MSMQIFDCEQGSAEWFTARMGIPTASEFKTIIGINKDAREKVTRRNYLYRLAGEILTGEPAENYSNSHMDRGNAMEPEARSWYAFLQDEEVKPVGFIRDGDKGASPDSLVGNHGVLEIKTALPSVLVDLLLKDEFPSAHMAQCQGNLWVAEREWLDLLVFWPTMPKLAKRIFRDENYIKMLEKAVSDFNSDLAETVAKIRAKAA
jgi:YqaJ-like recombinase protein